VLGQALAAALEQSGGKFVCVACRGSYIALSIGNLYSLNFVYVCIYIYIYKYIYRV